MNRYIKSWNGTHNKNRNWWKWMKSMKISFFMGCDPYRKKITLFHSNQIHPFDDRIVPVLISESQSRHCRLLGSLGSGRCRQLQSVLLIALFAQPAVRNSITWIAHRPLASTRCTGFSRFPAGWPFLVHRSHACGWFTRQWCPSVRLGISRLWHSAAGMTSP